MTRKLKNLSSTHHHFQLPNGGQETVSFLDIIAQFMIVHAVHLNCSDPWDRIPAPDCYVFTQSVFTEIYENRVKRSSHFQRVKATLN